MKTKENFFQQISNEFCWEGSSSYSILSEDEEKIILNCSANSICEHSGDIYGIEDNIESLMHKKEKIEGITYEVVKTSYKTNILNWNEDYINVHSSGEVHIKKTNNE